MKLITSSIILLLSFSTYAQDGTITVRKKQIVEGTWDLVKSKPKSNPQSWVFNADGSFKMITDPVWKYNTDSIFEIPPMTELESGNWEIHRDTLVIGISEINEELCIPSRYSYTVKRSRRDLSLVLIQQEGELYPLRKIQLRRHVDLITPLED